MKGCDEACEERSWRIRGRAFMRGNQHYYMFRTLRMYRECGRRVEETCGSAIWKPPEEIVDDASTFKTRLGGDSAELQAMPLFIMDEQRDHDVAGLQI